VLLGGSRAACSQTWADVATLELSVLVELGEEKKALALAAEIERSPYASEALRTQARAVQKETGPCGPRAQGEAADLSDAYRAFREGREAEARGEYDRAQHGYLRACALGGPRGPALYRAGHCAKLAGKQAEAQRLFDQALAELEAVDLASWECKPTTLSWSPDERLLALGCRDDGFALFTSTSLELLWRRRSESADRLLFSPDGTRLAAVGSSRVAVFDVASEQRLCELACEGPFTFSPDGRRLLAVCEGELRAWQASTGTLVERRPLPATGTLLRVFSPDARAFVAGVRQDNEVKLGIWDVARGEQAPAPLRIQVPPKDPKKQPSQELMSVAVSPDARLLVTHVGYDRNDNRWKTALRGDPQTIALWDLSTRRLLYTLPIPRGASCSLPREPFVASGKMFALACQELVSLVATDVGRPTAELPVWGADPVAVAPRTSRIALVADDTLQTWNFEPPGIENRRALHPESVGSVALTRAKDHLLVETNVGKIHRYNLKQDTPPVTLESKFDWVAFSPSGELFSSIGPRYSLEIHESLTGRLIQRLPAPQQPVTYDAGPEDGSNKEHLYTTYAKPAVAFSYDDRLVAFVSDHGVRVWDVRAGKFLSGGALRGTGTESWSTARGHRSLGTPDLGTWSLAFSPDGRWLAAIVAVSRVKEDARGARIRYLRWRIPDLELLPPLQRADRTMSAAGGGAPVTLEFSADGTRIVGCAQGFAMVWDSASGHLLTEIEPADSHQYLMQEGALLRLSNKRCELCTSRCTVDCVEVNPSLARATEPPQDRNLAAVENHGVATILRASLEQETAGPDQGDHTIRTEKLVSVEPYGASGSAVVRTPDGFVDTWGNAHEWLSCRTKDRDYPFELCEERYRVPGLLTKALRGDQSYREPK
jgi:WD40 repeat protein